MSVQKIGRAPSTAPTDTSVEPTIGERGSSRSPPSATSPPHSEYDPENLVGGSGVIPMPRPDTARDTDDDVRNRGENTEPNNALCSDPLVIGVGL